MRRVVHELFNENKLELADEFYHPDLQGVDPDNALPKGLSGPDQVRQVCRAYRQSFPDLHYTIDEIITTGNKAIIRFTGTMTHQGSFLGHAPTGRKATVSAIACCEFKEGKIYRLWQQSNRLGMMMQLGINPLHAHRVAEEAILRRWYEELWTKRNADIVDTLWHEEGIAHGVAGEKLVGRDIAKNMVKAFYQTFPKTKMEVQELVPHDDGHWTVYLRWSLETQAGQSCELTGVSKVRLQDSQLVEGWNYFDFLHLALQLGSLPKEALTEVLAGQVFTAR